MTKKEFKAAVSKDIAAGFTPIGASSVPLDEGQYDATISNEDVDKFALETTSGKWLITSCNVESEGKTFKSSFNLNDINNVVKGAECKIDVSTNAKGRKIAVVSF